MYTVARPPTPALCIEIDPSDESCSDEVENIKEEEVENTECSKPTCNTGRILVGRWGRSKLCSRHSSDPPEVIVNPVRLQPRPPKPTVQFSASSCKRTKLKEPKKVDKKIQNEQSKKPDEEDIESDDGRLIASKVLPIMAMLLQRNGRDESDEEKEKPEIPKTTSNLQAKLSVQCIQLLPSEAVTSRRH